jgi:hypothetical protein
MLTYLRNKFIFLRFRASIQILLATLARDNAMRNPLRSTLILSLLLGFNCTHLLAQGSQTINLDEKPEAEKSKTDKSKNESPGSKPPVVNIRQSDITKLQPPFHSRFGRAFEYKFERDEQPAFASGSTALLLNPEHYLNQHSLTFRFSELISTPVDTVSVIKQTFDDLKGPSDQGFQLAWCDSSSKAMIACLMKQSTFWKRAISGLSVTGSVFEWQGIQQGVIANEAVFPHYGKGGEVDFDPKNLFIRPADWKALADAVQKVSQGYRDDKTTLPRPKWWEALIPQFQYKRISQFDFVKNTGVLLPNPSPESGLNTYTFTWTLKPWIRDQPDHLAGDFFASHPMISDQEKAKIQKICITISGSIRNYISVPSTFTPDMCRSLANTITAPEYAIGCTSGNKVDAGSALRTRDGLSVDSGPVLNPCDWSIGAAAETHSEEVSQALTFQPDWK